LLKTAVVMPGIDVAKTIERTVAAIPKVDEIIFVDDGSKDASVDLALALGCTVVSHAKNLGYGAAQKTGYREALAGGADVVVMVHPDFQYKPELVPAMVAMVQAGYDVVLASRVLVNGAIAGGMPRWKWVANRALTAVENTMTGAGLSEYHTGYRAFSRRTLEMLPLADLRNDYVFDNEMLAQAIHFALPIGEISCPANYFDEMQTISFAKGVRYGIGCLGTTATYALNRIGVRSPIFDPHGPKLSAWPEGVRVERATARAPSPPR
jgi:glycosyltransferase involved in cell wall biosynthesis